MVNARNDAALSTGLSSALDRRRLAKQEELHNKRKADKEAVKARLSGLSTQGDIVMEWIDQEINDVNDFTKMVNEFDPAAYMKQIPLAQRMSVTNSELLQAQTLARMMHIEWLKSAKNRVKKHLKDPKSSVKEGENFEEDK